MKKFIIVAILVMMIIGGIKGGNFIMKEGIEKEFNKNLNEATYAEVMDYNILSGNVIVHVVNNLDGWETTLKINHRTGDYHVIGYRSYNGLL